MPEVMHSLTHGEMSEQDEPQPQGLAPASTRQARLKGGGPVRSIPLLPGHPGLKAEQRLQLEQVVHQFGSLTIPLARFFEEAIFSLPAASWCFGEGPQLVHEQTAAGNKWPHYKTFWSALARYRNALDVLHGGSSQQLPQPRLTQMEQAVRVSWRQLNAQFRLQLQRLIGDMEPHHKRSAVEKEGATASGASLLDMRYSRDMRYLLGLAKALQHHSHGLFVVDAAAGSRKGGQARPRDWLHAVEHKTPPLAPRAAASPLASHGVIVSTTTFGLCASASGWQVAIGMGFGSACLATRHTSRFVAGQAEKWAVRQA